MGLLYLSLAHAGTTHFQLSAQLGSELSTIVIGAMEGFISANNQLMQGQNYDNTGDIRSYFQGGMFVDFGGVDVNGVTNAMNAVLIGNAVNECKSVGQIISLVSTMIELNVLLLHARGPSIPKHDKTIVLLLKYY